MPTVAPLRGLRYDPKHVGALSKVIAPPYDVIDAALQAKLYEQHPANVIRIELNREEPGDGAQSNKYTRAARFLKEWREQGVVMQEPAAALYVYHQEFEVEGQRHVRRGVMARVRLERFGTGNIHPHEETMSGPKQVGCCSPVPAGPTSARCSGSTPIRTARCRRSSTRRWRVSRPWRQPTIWA